MGWQGLQKGSLGHKMEGQSLRRRLPRQGNRFGKGVSTLCIFNGILICVSCAPTTEGWGLQVALQCIPVFLVLSKSNHRSILWAALQDTSRVSFIKLKCCICLEPSNKRNVLIELCGLFALKVDELRLHVFRTTHRQVGVVSAKIWMLPD